MERWTEAFCRIATLSISPSLHLSISPSLHLSISPSLHLSISPSLHLSISPSLFVGEFDDADPEVFNRLHQFGELFPIHRLDQIAVGMLVVAFQHIFYSIRSCEDNHGDCL